VFRFEHPAYLWAALLIPVLALLFLLSERIRRRRMKRFAPDHLLPAIAPGYSRFKNTLKFGLLALGLAFLFVGWANPQWGSKKREVKREGIDVLIALDISQSMLAEDISPSRLDRAKRFAQNLTENLAGQRIGVILFACNAYLQVPLTTDYAFVSMFINSAGPDMAASQGTDIAAAIDLARQSFPAENKNHKALIVISDGEDHLGEGAASAGTAKADGMLVFTVGVGSGEGSLIPTFVNGRLDYLRDQTGNPVRSTMNEKTLTDIATAGDGSYFHLSSSSQEVTEALNKAIDQVEKREYEERSFTEYASYFQLFLGIGLLFILIEFLISYRQSRYLAGKDFFGS